MAKDEPINVEEPIVATELQEAPPEPEVKEESPPEAPKDEPEQPVEEKVEEPEEAPEETPEEEPPVSRRKAERLEKLESLVSRLKGTETPTSQPETPGTLDYGTALDAAPEVIQQLEADRKAATAASYTQGLEQAKSMQFHTRLEIDAPKIETKYPLFNKDSEDFNPAAANAINSWYLASVGFDSKTDAVANPNIRYADFVEGIMELADNMAGNKVEKTQANITKQAAQTGMRPDGSSAKRLNLNKAPSDMSDEELKAVLAQAGM